LKVVGGVLLYGGMLALLYATFALIRASRRQREPSASPAVTA
jgi:cbb3-type cytochrome oxidase subunit 1